MPDADFERTMQIQDAILEHFDVVNPYRFFDRVPVEAGRAVLEEKFAKMPSVPEGVKKIVQVQTDKFLSRPGDYRIPRHRVDLVMDMDQYRTIMGGGDFTGFAKNAAKSLAAGAARTLFQTQTKAGDANDVPHWGLIDVGTTNGTHSRPLTAGTHTKSGAWATSMFGATDLAGPRGLIHQHRDFDDGTPLVMFYPSIASVPLNLIVPDISGAVVFFRELALRIYGAIEPIGNVRARETGAAAVNIMTGAAETATNFQLVMVNPNWFFEIGDIPPIARIFTNDKLTQGTLHLEYHGALKPIPFEDTDGKIYKAMSFVDTCGA